MKARLLTGGLIAAAVLGACPAVQAAPKPLKIEAFAAPARFTDIALSPSGRRIAVATEKKNQFVLQVWDAADLDLKSKPRAEYILGVAPRLNWLRWKGDDRLLFSVTIPEGGPDQVVAQTRLMSTDAALKQTINLGQRPGSWSEIPALQDQVASWLPGDPESVLVAIDWKTPDRPALRKVDVATGAADLIRDNDSRITGWIVDPDGHPRIAVSDPSNSGDPAYFRVGSDGALSPLASAGPDGGLFRPLGFDGSPIRLVVLSDHEGGAKGLYVYDLDKEAFAETLLKSPRHDVDGAVFSPDGRTVVGATYQDDHRRIEYIDPAFGARVEAAGRLAGVKNPTVLDATPDGARMLIADEVDGRIQEAWWVDLPGQEARSFGRQRESLDKALPSMVVAVGFRARDGLEIPGYVTLPPGVTSLADAHRLPFVVMPHGGPSARDGAAYEGWARFVASRGYAVLEPNFRRSGTFGEAFRAAGASQWRRSVRNDVADGTKWLVAQGYADPDRLCVVGGSFGGYTALMTSIENADLYRCAASVAGIADPERPAEEAAADEADAVRVPVLLVHGTADWTAPVAQSRLMRDHLQAAGKPFTYKELDLADHDLSREKDRAVFLTALEDFLKENLGPGVVLDVKAPPPALRQGRN